MSGGAWTYTVAHYLVGLNGACPEAGPVLGAGGILCGTASEGGVSGLGTVFALTL
jgi:hypothetical protein